MENVEGEQAEEPKHSTLVLINGKSFRCQCGCNVFNQPKPDSEPNIYVCNACGTEYDGS